ncbi:MAG TPA: C25 family cysteine peptidase, partial [Chitinophagales bacterium]|nr:C25 family cysteine peptidase [Chitinophagales bacterium]
YEIEVKYNQTDPAGEGWLRYLLLNARRQLVMPNGQMGFRDRLSVGSNNIANFAIQADNNIEVWDVSHIDLVQQINLTNNGNTKSFVANANELREYIAFDNTYYLKAEAVGKVDNQNLHQVTFPDYIVITHPNFLVAAERIAQHHATYNQLSTKVVTTEQVYNEFASGAADITALRDFIKMYYDRADGDENLMPQSVLLLGDASYDFKNRKYSAEDNHNFVPTYQSVETLNSSDTYCTDDYFAYLDDNEGNNLSSSAIRLDVAIGRLAARTETEALAMVDKVIHYVTADVCKADWRNTLCFIADDQDGNLHLGDAEDEANAIRNSNKNYNVNKIYLDA